MDFKRKNSENIKKNDERNISKGMLVDKIHGSEAEKQSTRYNVKYLEKIGHQGKA
jgi:hypothetical protein